MHGMSWANIHAQSIQNTFIVLTSLTDTSWDSSLVLKDKRRTSEVTTLMYNLAVATGKTLT
jgi:hypothetical protein